MCGWQKFVHSGGGSKRGALLASSSIMTDLQVNPAAEASLRVTSAPVLRLEQQTAKIPSHWFLLGAIGSMATSLLLELTGRSRVSRFVAQWPAPLLIMGMYNKLVKTLGTR
jgi:hypothetical protein